MTRWLVTLFAVAGCGYPEFGFRPDVVDAMAGDTQATAETNVARIDSSSPDTAIEPDRDSASTVVIDSASVSDSAADTKIADSSSDTPSVTPDTSLPRGCAVAHAYCQNFDTSTSATAGWSSSYVSGGGMLALDTTTSTSSPASLVATLGASMGTASALVAKEFTVTTTSSTVRAEADMMVDSLAYGGPGAVILFKIQRNGDGDGVSLTLGSAGMLLESIGSTTAKWPVTGITAGKWFHVRLDAVLHSSAGSAKLWINDMSTPQLTKTGISSASVDALTRQVIAGQFGYLGSSPFKVHYDDVSIDLP